MTKKAPRPASIARPAVLRAAIYDRVSEEKNGAGTSRSPGDQSAANEQAAAELGVTVVLRCVDPGISASRFSKKVRPDWERIIAAITAGDIDILIVWESSRGDRKLTESSQLLDLCRETGVLVHVTSHHRTYDLSVARDWRSLAEDAVDSAYESEKTSDRVLRTSERCAAEGRPHGRVAYGYERIYDERTKQLTAQQPHPEHAPVVRKIIGDVASAVPITVIARDLNARGVPVPGTKGERWVRQAVRRIALNPVYIGKRLYRGELLDGDWPALIDEATHYGAVRLLSDPARLTTKPGAIRHLLTGWVRCAVCHSGMRVKHPSPGKGRVRYYCYDNHCVSHPVAELDEIVITSVMTKLADGAFNELTSADDAEILAARDDAARLRARRAEARDAFAAGSLPIEALTAVEAKLGPQITEAEARAVAAVVPRPVRTLIGDGTANYHELRGRFEALSVAAQRDVLRALVRVTLHRYSPEGFERVLIEPAA